MQPAAVTSRHDVTSKATESSQKSNIHARAPTKASNRHLNLAIWSRSLMETNVIKHASVS